MSSKLKPQLVIIEGKDKGKVIPLRHGTLVFGRSKGDVIVQDPRVSRSHIEVHFDSKLGKITYTDLKSLNGTFVNGETVTGGELKDGDQLQVGDTTFDVHFAVDTSAKPAASDPEPQERSELPLEPQLSMEATPIESAKPTVAKAEPEPGKKRQSLFSKLSPRARIAALLLLIGLGVLYLLPSKPSVSLEESLVQVDKFVQEGKLDEATQLATSLTEQFPEDHKGYLVLAELYTVQKKNDLAIATYKKILGMKGAPDSVQLRLIALYLRSGMTAEAKEARDQMDRIIKETVKKFVGLVQDEKKTPDVVLKEHPEIRELLISTAKIFIEFSGLSGVWDEEKTLILAKGLETNIAPNEAVGFILHAQILYKRGEVPKAAGLALEASKRAGNDPFALEYISDLQFKVGDYSAAAASAQKWQALVPKSVALKALMAKLSAQAAIQESEALVEGAAIVEKMKTVLDHLKTAEEHDPNDEWILEQKALAHLKRYELDEATAVAEQWMQVYPQSPKALIVMSYVKFYLGKPEDALPMIQKVIQMGQSGGDSRYVPDAVYLYGRVFAQQNKLEDAKKYIQMSCKLGSKEACSDALIKDENPVATQESEPDRNTTTK